VQQRAEQELQSRRLLGALEEALSAAVSSPDEWVELDRVEIELGTLQSAVVERQLAERLPERLPIPLAHAVAAARQQQAVRTGQVNDLEQFLYFLKNGVLPAYALAQPARQWEPQLITLTGTLNSDQQASLRQALMLPTARQRLIYQFSVSLWLSAASALEVEAAPYLRQMAELLLQLRHLPHNEVAEPFDSLIWEKIMQRLSFGLKTDWSVLLAQIEVANEAAESRQIEKAGKQLTEVVAGSLSVVPSLNAVPKASLSEAVQYIPNAGVVLLHSFLAPCFEACGWLAADKFRNDTAQMQAVRLVYFLATGNSQAAEYELLLSKLLCGVPASAPQNTRVRLPRQARVEGTELLTAVIQRWPVLQNTAAGLREAFLQREGKLERAADDSWTLTVEQKAQDVLLNQLPHGWGLGVVRLPWMPQRLLVNWG
jgi:hypothetical protein